MPMETQMRSISLQEEFEKNPELNKEDLDLIRQWTLSQKHLPKVPDEMLVKFLHSCYYDVSRAQDCIEAYYTIRSSAPSLFNNRDVMDPVFRKYINALNIAILPLPDRNGNTIFYHGLRDYEPSNYSFLHDHKLIYMTFDAWLARNGTTPGFIFLLDMKGAKIAHLPKVVLSVLRINAKYVQEASPVRLKDIHILNTLSWVDSILAITRPFLKKEIMQMMQFHKENSSTLYEFVPRESLPSTLGGTLPSIEELSDENVRILEGFTEFFLEDEKIRVDETKRVKTKKHKETVVEETSSSFKKLDID